MQPNIGVDPFERGRGSDRQASLRGKFMRKRIRVETKSERRIHDSGAPTPLKEALEPEDDVEPLELDEEHEPDELLEFTASRGPRPFLLVPSRLNSNRLRSRCVRTAGVAAGRLSESGDTDQGSECSVLTHTHRRRGGVRLRAGRESDRRRGRAGVGET